MGMTQTIKWCPFSYKQKKYIKDALINKMSVAEGAIRSSKTIMHCIVACAYLETCEDKIHLASGSTLPNAKLNIGDCNGFGLEHLFRGRCRWGKFKENQCLYIYTQTGEKIVIFAGGGKADSYKKILGNSYGLWIATEINEHYDCDDSKTSFIKVAMARQVAAINPKILWDMNPSKPNDRIYLEYVDNYKINGLVGGYNYEHFTLHDNLSITEQRLKEIKSQYVFGSIWYRRDILGERVLAEGLCYEDIVNNIKDLFCDKQYFINKIAKINIGVDFGGNKSATTFCATAILQGLKEIVVIKAKRIKKSMTPIELESEFNKFTLELVEEYNRGMTARCDSEESVLINGLRVSNARVCGRVNIINALKTKIKGRISALNKLGAKKKVRFYKDGDGVEEVIKAISQSVYEKDTEERLDEVSFENPIDMMDAFEYSWEEFIPALTQLNV